MRNFTHIYVAGKVGFQAKLALPKARLALPDISVKADFAYKIQFRQSQLCLIILGNKFNNAMGCPSGIALGTYL